jgi:hypothetical protein
MSSVTAGQHFRDPNPTLFGHPQRDWVVDEVFVGTDGKQYAHVHAESKPHERKTLSTAVLRDKRRFVPVRAKSGELP